MGSVSNNGQFLSTVKTEPEDLTAYVQQVRAQALQKELDMQLKLKYPSVRDPMKLVCIDNTESARPPISGEFRRC